MYKQEEFQKTSRSAYGTACTVMDTIFCAVQSLQDLERVFLTMPASS
jgi:hypothetical protein